MGLHLADFSVNVSDLEKMRTFPSSVPLPDLDGDLEFLDFFDPFLGLPPKQVEAFTLPPFNTEGWSPLENFSGSSQTSMQDYGFHQSNHLTTHESPSIDNNGQSWEAAYSTPWTRPLIHSQQLALSLEDLRPYKYRQRKLQSRRHLPSQKQ